MSVASNAPPGSSRPASVSRIACIVVPDFALAALYRTEPELRDALLALTDRPGPRGKIVALSERAAARGIRAGLTAAQGSAICAGLTLRTLPAASPADSTESTARASEEATDYRRSAQAALVEVAASCSPRVEDASAAGGNDRHDRTGYGTVYLDARGVPFPSEEALGAALTARAARVGLDVRVGIASTKMTARVAAHRSAGVMVVPRGAERRFLAPLPLALLEPDPDLAAVLARWGITRLGELACLSPAALGTRLGADGARLVLRARGEDRAPLVSRPTPASFQEDVVLDHGIDTLEPLAFVLRGCLDRLVIRLDVRGFACGGLRLSLGLGSRACEERTVAVAAPTLDAKVLLTLARLSLEAASPHAPVETIRVTALPASVRAEQLDLYRPAGPAPERLATTLARLVAICGPGRVGAPGVVDSHRPEALALVPFDPPHVQTSGQPHARALPPDGSCRLALRAIRPPRPIQVFDSGGQPDFVRGDGLGGRVVALAGPWRLAGEWWTEARFARDYYDMSLSDGGVYRIYRDRKTARWFVAGEYD
jgi:protein ImuB